MKREDLQKIEGLTKEQIDAVMKVHQVDVEANKSKLADLESKHNEATAKIEELSAITKKYEGVDIDALKKEVNDWEDKYKKGLAEKDKEYAKRVYFDGIKFSSKYAKKAAMEEFDSKELEFKDGKFLGADDFIDSLKKSDPDAFAQEPNKKASSGMSHGGQPGADEDDGVMNRFYELNPSLKPKN